MRGGIKLESAERCNCAFGEFVSPQGYIKLWIGPRTVPVRNGLHGSRTFWFFEHPGLFLCAANRDGSRSVAARGMAALRWINSPGFLVCLAGKRGRFRRR